MKDDLDRNEIDMDGVEGEPQPRLYKEHWGNTVFGDQLSCAVVILAGLLGIAAIILAAGWALSHMPN